MFSAYGSLRVIERLGMFSACGGPSVVEGLGTFSAYGAPGVLEGDLRIVASEAGDPPRAPPIRMFVGKARGSTVASATMREAMPKTMREGIRVVASEAMQRSDDAMQ